MKIIVKQGDVHVNSVHALVKHDDVIILLADTKEKRPEISCYSGETIYFVKDGGGHDNPSSITLEGLEGSRWMIFAESGRYSLNICLVKLPYISEENFPLEWFDEPQSNNRATN